MFLFQSNFTSLSMLLIQFADLIGVKDQLIQLLINHLYCHENKGTRIFSIHSSVFSIFLSYVRLENRKTVECSLQSLIEHFNLNLNVNKGLFSLGNVSVFFVCILRLYSLSHVSFPHTTITAHISFTTPPSVHYELLIN